MVHQLFRTTFSGTRPKLADNARQHIDARFVVTTIDTTYSLQYFVGQFWAACVGRCGGSYLRYWRDIHASHTCSARVNLVSSIHNWLLDLSRHLLPPKRTEFRPTEWRTRTKAGTPATHAPPAFVLRLLCVGLATSARLGRGLTKYPQSNHVCRYDTSCETCFLSRCARVLNDVSGGNGTGCHD